MATQSSTYVETIELLMRRVASVCDKHRVASGLPADLTDFVAALEHDKLLAMDFWAVVGDMNAGHSSVSKDGFFAQGDSANVQSAEMQEEVLEAIVRVVTGLGVSEMITLGDQTLHAVENLQSLMGGQDIQSRHVEAASAKAAAAEPSDVRAVGYKYQNIPGMRPAESQPAQLPPNESRTDEAKVEAQRSGVPAESRKGAEDSVAKDVKESLNGPAWSEFLSTDWIAADLKAAEQKRASGATDRVHRSYRRDDSDIRRVLFPEGSLKSSENAAATDPVVMKSTKLTPAWIEPRKLMRVAASALLIVTISAVIIRLQDSGVLRSYAVSIKEMFSGSGTAGDGQQESASTAKGAAQPVKLHGISGAHAKAHPAKTEDESADVAVKLESSETAKTDGGSKAVAEKLPVAYESGGGSTAGTIVSPAKVNPIEVAPEVMKANLITPAGPDSSFATGLEEGNSPVVLQVVISKQGAVESLRVMEGDSALRAAAKRAVSAWRYQPYLVHGMPVAVRTTVTVNFKMAS